MTNENMAEQFPALEELLLDVSEAARFREETKHCVQELELSHSCPKGWKGEFHKTEHPANCRHCRHLVTSTLRVRKPGLWILDERERANTDRPLWWRHAIEDYLALDATFAHRFVGWLRDAVAVVPVVYAESVSRQTAPQPLRSRKVLRQLYLVDPQDQLFYTELEEEITVDEVRQFRVSVHDLDPDRRPDKLVLVTLSGSSETMVREVVLEQKGYERIGVVVLPDEDFRRLGDNVRLLPSQFVTKEELQEFGVVEYSEETGEDAGSEDCGGPQNLDKKVTPS